MSRKSKPRRLSKEGPIQLLRRHAKGVLRTLGKGHSERVYHRAMITSLNSERIPHRSEVIAPIYFMREVVGFGRCDIVLQNLVVEFKANRTCPRRTSDQLQKYLESMRQTSKRAAPIRGVVINFSQKTGLVEVFQSAAPSVRKRPSC
jgi:GxxExxY protein